MACRQPDFRLEVASIMAHNCKPIETPTLSRLALVLAGRMARGGSVVPKAWLPGLRAITGYDGLLCLVLAIDA